MSSSAARALVRRRSSGMTGRVIMDERKGQRCRGAAFAASLLGLNSVICQNIAVTRHRLLLTDRALLSLAKRLVKLSPRREQHGHKASPGVTIGYISSPK